MDIIPENALQKKMLMFLSLQIFTYTNLLNVKILWPKTTLWSEKYTQNILYFNTVIILTMNILFNCWIMLRLTNKAYTVFRDLIETHQKPKNQNLSGTLKMDTRITWLLIAKYNKQITVYKVWNKILWYQRADLL